MPFVEIKKVRWSTTLKDLGSAVAYVNYDTYTVAQKSKPLLSYP